MNYSKSSLQLENFVIVLIEQREVRHRCSKLRFLELVINNKIEKQYQYLPEKHIKCLWRNLKFIINKGLGTLIKINSINDNRNIRDKNGNKKVTKRQSV